MPAVPLTAPWTPPDRPTAPTATPAAARALHHRRRTTRLDDGRCCGSLALVGRLPGGRGGSRKEPWDAETCTLGLLAFFHPAALRG